MVEEWLVGADSIQALAPEGYDDAVAEARVRALHERLLRSLPEYSVKTSSPALYQDSTGLAHCRIASMSDDAALAWIVLSHFGDLATVQDCVDSDLLSRILGSLEALEFKFIEYGYLVSHTYDGKCPALAGGTWANRYFALEVDWSAKVSVE